MSPTELNPPAGPPPVPEARPDVRETRGARVMVVDGDPRHARTLASTLARDGYDVCRVESGDDALGRLVRSGEAGSADLLLLDAAAPGLDGVEICARLRSDPALCGLPIVILTDDPAAPEKDRALAAGADDFLTRPVRRADLLARVASLLRVKRLQEQCEAARRDLAATHGELRKILEQRAALTQMIVHDLRSPLTGISGYAQLLKIKAASGPQDLDRLADRLLLASRHMQRMLADLMDVTLLEERRFPLERAPIDLRRAASKALEEHRAGEISSDVRIELTEALGDDGDPAVAVADEGLVRRIISNLVAYATKHSPSGSTVRVVVGTPRDGRLEVLVAETADGPACVAPPPAESGPRQAVSASPLERGVTLAFCRLAVEAHGGRIWVKPNATGGRTFGFFVPVSPEET